MREHKLSVVFKGHASSHFQPLSMKMRKRFEKPKLKLKLKLKRKLKWMDG